MGDKATNKETAVGEQAPRKEEKTVNAKEGATEQAESAESEKTKEKRSPSFKPLRQKQKAKKKEMPTDEIKAELNSMPEEEKPRKIEVKETPVLCEPPKPKEKESVVLKESLSRSPLPDKQTETDKPCYDNKKKNWFEAEGQLVVDVYQTNDEIVIQSAVAGLKPRDLDICIENDVVTIRGKREKPGEKAEVNYFYQECYWGPFSREIILPAEVDASRTNALMKDGILTIRIPKIDKERRRKINIKE